MQKYSQMSKLLERALNSRSSLKNIIFQHTTDTNFIRQTYALLSKAMEKYDQIMDILQQLQDKEYLDVHSKHLVIILMLDLFNPENVKRKKIGGQIASYLKRHQEFIKGMLEYSIRYLRKKFGPLSFEYTEDEHIPNLVKVDYDVYSKHIKENPEFLKSNDHIVQGKSSALPAYLLFRDIQSKNLKFDVIDCCAAPGNKTIQLSNYMNDKQVDGKVIAVEMDSKRHEILRNRIIKYKCDNTTTINGDFLQLNPKDYPTIKMALLDPSCSGSGMLQQRLLQGQQDRNIQVPEDKLDMVQSLAKMQLSMLNQLAKFPNLRRIVYSTCSLYKQEDEDVANRFLEQHPQWQAVYLFPEWVERGIDNNTKYVRVWPGEHDGFFVAMFRRGK